MSQVVLLYLRGCWGYLQHNIRLPRQRWWTPWSHNDLIWTAVKLKFKSCQLCIEHWESSIPSLLCTAMNETPHQRMFNVKRRSTIGVSIKRWMSSPAILFFWKDIAVLRSMNQLSTRWNLCYTQLFRNTRVAVGHGDSKRVEGNGNEKKTTRSLPNMLISVPREYWP